jgi:hypothetical protein
VSRQTRTRAIGVSRAIAHYGLIFFGAGSLTRALDNYVQHHQQERNHQGRENLILFPPPSDRVGFVDGEIVRRERLGGMLSFYHREAG